MKNFFVIGNSASKSLSPLIFNHWFKRYKIYARYSYVETNKKNFDKVLLKQILNKKTAGFNVTTPFKKSVLKHLDKKNHHAEKIGAVNCVTIGKKIIGSNTDWIGYLGSVKGLKIKKTNNILILGYGGASQAIVYGFFSKGFKNIVVFNRTKKAIFFKESRAYTKNYSLIDNHLSEADLIVNTTPTNPLNKKQTKLVRSSTVVSDIVYRPMNTKFLNSFKKNKKVHGITMLLEQAIPCFLLWFGFTPSVDRALIKKIYTKIR